MKKKNKFFMQQSVTIKEGEGYPAQSDSSDNRID